MAGTSHRQLWSIFGWRRFFICNFAAAVAKRDFVHQLIDEEYAAPARLHHVVGCERVGDAALSNPGPGSRTTIMSSPEHRTSRLHCICLVGSFLQPWRMPLASAS